jgi:hypothetical protein
MGASRCAKESSPSVDRIGCDRASSVSTAIGRPDGLARGCLEAYNGGLGTWVH